MDCLLGYFDQNHDPTLQLDWVTMSTKLHLDDKHNPRPIPPSIVSRHLRANVSVLLPIYHSFTRRGQHLLYTDRLPSQGFHVGTGRWETSASNRLGQASFSPLHRFPQQMHLPDVPFGLSFIHSQSLPIHSLSFSRPAPPHLHLTYPDCQSLLFLQFRQVVPNGQNTMFLFSAQSLSN